MKKKLTILLSLLMLSLSSSCGSEKEEPACEKVYEIEGVTFYNGDNYFLDKVDECCIYNEEENSVDIGNLTGAFDFKHYAFIKDDIVCIGEFAKDYDTNTKSVYNSNLTVKEYCSRQIEGYDVIYVGPYFRCYKEKNKYNVFSYPLSFDKESLYDGKEKEYYLPEGSELKYFGESKVPYGVNTFTKEETIDLMSMYLKAIFINYDTMNYKKLNVPEENKNKEKDKKEEKIAELCLRLEDKDQIIL